MTDQHQLEGGNRT